MLWRHYRVNVRDLEVNVEETKAFGLGCKQENISYLTEEAKCVMESDRLQM